MPRDGRWLLVLAFLGLAGALVAAAASGRLFAAWYRLGVMALEPTFADTRVYTSGWECTRDEIDVFAANPCYPWGRALVPQLLRWARSPEPAVPHALWAVAALVATLWLSTSIPVVPGLSDAWLDVQGFPFDEVLNWFLFVYLATALFVTAPPWLRRLFARSARQTAATPQRA